MSGRPVNATVGSLLGFLHDGPQSGWDLVRTAEQAIGDFWSLTRSQVYRELTAMAEQGLVEVDQTGARDRRAYRLTAAGRSAFQDWLAREPGPEQIRYPLLLTLAFARHHDPVRLAAFVAHHRQVHLRRLADYRAEHAAARAAGAPLRELVTLDFGLRYEAAVLDWFDHLPDDVVRPEAGTDGSS